MKLDLGSRGLFDLREALMLRMWFKVDSLGIMDLDFAGPEQVLVLGREALAACPLLTSGVRKGLRCET